MLKLLARLLGGRSRATPPPAAVPASRPDRDAALAAAIDAARSGRRADAIAGLRQLLETDPDFAEAHLQLGVLLHEQGNFEEARDCYLLASVHRPDWWPPHLQLGTLAIDSGRIAEAAPPLARAIELGAEGAEVHDRLGAAHLHAGDFRAAAASLRTALALDPDLVTAHVNLGYVLFKNLEEYDEGERHIARALELAPGNSAAQCNRVMVLQQRGRCEEALALADRLLAADPSRAEVRMNRALMALAGGEWDAWVDYEARRRLPESRKSADLPWPDWDGSSLGGKTIYVYREQGIGDEIMFASCLPEVIAQARRCFVEVSPKLAPLFRRSFPAATVLLRDEWREARQIARDAPDFKAAIGSLPRFFRRSAGDFPDHDGYLAADAHRVTTWKAKLAQLPSRRKIGISWRGGLATTSRSLRSIPLEKWLPVLSTPDVDFVSLQYGEVTPELEALRQAHGVRVTHWPEAIDDYDETAALVRALDLVVSVQTAIVHLSGALGTRALALIPAIPEWRYGAAGEAMIWYPSVRLLRQSSPGAWEPVIDAARREIDARMSDDPHVT